MDTMEKLSLYISFVNGLVPDRVRETMADLGDRIREEIRMIDCANGHFADEVKDLSETKTNHGKLIGDLDAEVRGLEQRDTERLKTIEVLEKELNTLGNDVQDSREREDKHLEKIAELHVDLKEVAQSHAYDVQGLANMEEEHRAEIKELKGSHRVTLYNR